MIFLADTSGDAVDQAVEATYSLIVTRDRVLHVVDLVVAVVRLSSDEHLQVHQAPTDLVNISLLLMCVLFLITVS